MSASAIVVLDGGTGTELRYRGIEVPSHITSIWSARAVFANPEAVVDVHRDYIEAGADVVTINNYAITQPLLAREGLEHRLEELTLRACELAERARDGAARRVRLAGSLPPLDTSYRAELVGEDDAILGAYREIAAVLAPRVDILLCETLSSAREARAAAVAATEAAAATRGATRPEVWLSWTLQGDRPDHLPSGETLPEAFEQVADLPIDAFAVNCCGANFATRAIPILRSLTERPVGAYANSADVEPLAEGATPSDPEQATRHGLDIAGYEAAVAEWLGAGAAIVGGCCGTRPAHVARLRALVDALA